MIYALIGIAVMIGLGAWLRSTSSSRSIRFLQFVIMIAATLVAAAAAGTVGKYARQALGGGPMQAEQMVARESGLEQFRQMPLVGLVLADNPAVEDKMRDAIAADLRASSRDNPQHLFRLGAEIRRRFIIPALVNADDAPVLEAARTLQELATHLQRQDVQLCNALAVTGTEYVSKLDEAGLVILQRALMAQEEAYRSGKARTASRQPTSDEELRHLLAEAGYTAADFAALKDIAKLPPAESCAAAIKLYGAAGLLPPDRGANVARYLLTR